LRSVVCDVKVVRGGEECEVSREVEGKERSGGAFGCRNAGITAAIADQAATVRQWSMVKGKKR